ncbi:hypothetical protein RvY_07693 [Ramazzottius varieornatus]|uniref:Uncharacterized protein n=1 Tax=Ramazzottius varieornatus TaxID=947166 RepID=A0A1D1V964_RAMVA|nr:hypothetical protein RvY_07693 [Ramazzottius varieornatus]
MKRTHQADSTLRNLKTTKVTEENEMERESDSKFNTDDHRLGVPLVVFDAKDFAFNVHREWSAI